MPPKEYIFERDISLKLSKLSFQRPDSIADGLALIWVEKFKWAKISAKMGINESDAKKTLSLIADRRNAIVHESDMDPITNTKTSISRSECISMTDFIELCGKSIAELVRQETT